MGGESHGCEQGKERNSLADQKKEGSFKDEESKYGRMNLWLQRAFLSGDDEGYGKGIEKPRGNSGILESSIKIDS